MKSFQPVKNSPRQGVKNDRVNALGNLYAKSIKSWY